MIKLLNQYFPGRLFLLLVTENVLMLVAIWAVVSFQIGSIQLALLTHPQLLARAFLITFICQGCLYYGDIYNLRAFGSRADVFIRLLQAFGVAALILATMFYVFPATRLGGGIVEAALVAVVIGIVGWRVLIEWLNRSYVPGERVMIIGSGDTAQSLAREIRLRKDLPIEVVGSVIEDSLIHSGGVIGVPMLGPLSQLEAVLEKTRPDRLIVALKERRQQLPIQTLLKLRMNGLLIEEASTLFQKITGKIPVESIHPSSLIFSEGFKQSTLRRIYGRSTGFVAALLSLIVVGPLMLLVALAIKLDSRGPIFYKQERVGKGGNPFFVLKFRSMRVDAESLTGPVWAQEDDPRITRVGKWLRKLRLDELPQFINVLRGDMSFIGPRPERPYFVEMLKQQIPFYDLRHSVRPGITGWAQVSHHYGASVDEAKEKLEYDLFYIKNMSISLDLLILVQTVKIVIFGRGR